jgi:hemolysin III
LNVSRNPHLNDFHYSPLHELANALTHGLGAALSLAGLAALVTFAALHGTAWEITACAIFGASMVALYLTSTLYHCGFSPAARRWLRKLDHAAIFLLIAGTYTPFALLPLRGPWGWTLLAIIWGLAVPGIILKFKFAGRFDKLSTAIYLAMGWLALVAIKPLFEHLSTPSLVLLGAGGVSYTVGAIFYLWERLPFHHAIWHLFVLGGTACHFFAIWLLLPAS